MPAIFTPLRIDRVQRAVFEVLSEATGVDVGWAHSEVPHQALTGDFVNLTMIGGPGPTIRKHRRGTPLQPIDTVTLTVGPVVVGRRLGIDLNHFNYFEDVTTLDTDSTVRDRLLGQVNDVDNLEPVTASTSGADGLVLAADHLGGIISLAIYGAITAGTPVLNSDHVMVTEGSESMLVNIQAFSKQREIRLGAPALLQLCIAAFAADDMVEKLRRFGVGVGDSSTPLDLSAVAGAHWEPRSSFDVTLTARARWVRPVDVIETVTGTINGNEFSASAP